MRRQSLNSQDTRDAIHIVAAFWLIIMTSLIHLAAAVLLTGIFVVGLLMIFDHTYLPLFDQWVVASILYGVYRVATFPQRTSAGGAFMVVMMGNYPNDDAESDPDLDSGAAWSERAGTGYPVPRAPPLGTYSHPPLIGHRR